MPTGYTSDLYEGKDVTFQEFAAQCARAMQPLVMMREEPMDAPIPEKFEPSSYHIEKLDEAKKDLKELESLPDQEAESRASREYGKDCVAYEKSVKNQTAIAARYNKMLKKVEAWTPPSDDHVPFKDYMREQLTESIDFDCHFYGEAPKRLSGKEWLKKKIKKAEWNIDYHWEENEGEKQRAEDRTEWVQKLRESLSED